MVMLRRPALPPQVGEDLVDLFGQFARGRDDQRAHPIARAFFEALKNGQGEGRGLAGAGLGQADHVTTRHDGRDGLLLNGRRREVTKRLNARHKARAEVQFCECH